jgi:two-component system sensor histidine kinase TctE
LSSPAGGAGPASGPFARGAGDSRSLFGELLDWVLAPLLFLWPMSLALTWGVAQDIAHRPYDRQLERQVQALAEVATVRASAPPRPIRLLKRDLDIAAAALLRGDDESRRWFQVLGSRGELLAGDATLTVPDDRAAYRRLARFRDDLLHDEPVRVAWLWLAAEGDDPESDALVQVAETLEQRQQLATEIIKGVLLPQFAILPLAVLLVWLALSRGIRPLENLQRRIRRRESTDLSPIAEGDVPEEVAPLVRSINDLLQRLDRSIATQRHFLADAAHQLKTPLAGLRTQAELAARELDGGTASPASMKHSLRQIALASQRAAHMVNQLLAMARAEDSGAKLRREWIDLGAITRAVVRDFVPRAIERHIDLGYEGPDPIRAEEGPDAGATRLHGDPVLLGEMVRNLVDNALRYTPVGGVVTVRLLPDPFGQGVVLQVEDSGPGIAPAERALVFQPFYRSLGTEADGSGLGLAVVQEVAQRHGGSVDVTDARPGGGPGQPPGALFTVRLPRRLAAADATGEGSAADPPGVAAPARSPR